MKVTGIYPRVGAHSGRVAAVGHTGGVLLTETVRVSGLDRCLPTTLARWRKPLAQQDPAKVVVLDLAITLAVGGDAMSDIATVRAEPALYGAAASGPTVSRTITTLAADAEAALAAINQARQQARTTARGVAGRSWRGW